MRFLIIAPISNLYPSGIPIFVRTICSELSVVSEKIILILEKSVNGIALSKSATEYYSTPKGNLNIEWVPSDYFTKFQRHCLTYRIEEIVNKNSIDIVVSIGAYRSGFCATVASKLCNIKHFAIILYEDSFKHHLNNSEGLNVTIRNSDSCACFNPLVSEHLKIFYGPNILCPAFDNKDLLGDMRFNPDDEDRKFIRKKTENELIVLSTGLLNESNHLNDLVNRASDYIGKGYKWIHAGIISPQFLIKLVTKLTIVGYAESFELVNIISRTRFLLLISETSVILIPEGSRDTRIIEVEANSFDIQIDAPPAYFDNESSKTIKINDWIRGIAT